MVRGVNKNNDEDEKDKTYFNKSWLNHVDFKEWLEEDVDGERFKCTWCTHRESFALSNMGIQALKHHMTSKKHLSYKKSKQSSNSITSYFGGASSSVSNNSSATATSTTAEIYWAMKCVKENWSANSSDDNNALFTQMFPDSEIAKKFCMNRTKFSYVVNFGLGPFFKNVLTERVSKSAFFSISFDECFNKVLQKTQMDLIVRYMHERKVYSQYLSSAFLGRCKAVDLKKAIMKEIEGLNLSNLIQISMDGPNVNHALAKKMEADRESAGLPQMINTGSCSLHIVHGAFKCGAQATDWNLKKVLQCLHCLFDNTSARRDDYITTTGSSDYPLSFCETRWLESQPVAERAILIWPNVVQMVHMWQRMPVSQRPQGKDFSAVCNAVRDPLFLPRLHFFSFVASILKPYLEKHQQNGPSVPYMYDDLKKLVKRLMTLVFRPAYVAEQQSSLLDVNTADFDDETIQKSEVECGCAASQLLRTLKSTDQVTSTAIKKFHMDCKLFVFAVLRKVKSRMLVGIPFLKRAACLNPAKLGELGKDRVVRHFTRLVQHLTCLKIVSNSEGDQSIEQYIDLLASSVSQLQFEKFETSQRLDDFYFHTLNLETRYPSLSRVVQVVFILHNGQADVERGFSLNKDVISTNMGELTIKSRRMVKDHLRVNSLKVPEVKLTTPLLQSVKCARARYTTYLEEQRSKKEVSVTVTDEEEKGTSLKNVQDEKESLEKLFKSLNKDSARYSTEAYQQPDFDSMKALLAKNEAVKRKAAKVEAEIEALEKKISVLQKKKKK